MGVLALVASCSNELTQPVVSDDLVAITVEPASWEPKALGDTIRFNAEATRRSGSAAALLPSWETLDAEIVGIDPQGLARALSPGLGRIVAVQEGLADTVEVTVVQVPRSLALSVDSMELTGEGARDSLEAQILDANGYVIEDAPPITWESLNDGVATVTSTGGVVARAAGTTAVVASLEPAVIDTAWVTVLATFPPPQVTPVHLVPTSVDATGATDVTRQLNEFFASVPDGSVIRFQRGGRYRVEGTVLLREREDITIDGNAGMLFAQTTGTGVVSDVRRRVHLLVSGGSNITVRNLAIRGAHPAGGTGTGAYVAAFEAQHGLELASVSGVTVEGVRITDVYGDFLYLGRNSHRGEWTRDVVIRDCHFERNGRQGIAITAAENVLVEDCYMGQVRRSSVDLEPNTDTGGALNITFRNNTFGPGRLLWVASKGQGPFVRNVRFVANQLEGKAMVVTVASPVGHRRGPFEFVGNTSDQGYGTTSGAVMGFTRVDGIVVTDNHQPTQAGRNMALIKTSESCGIEVSGNTGANMVVESRIEPYPCPTPP